MRIIKNLLFITVPVTIALIILIEVLLQLFFPIPDPYLRFKDRRENYFIPSQMPANARYRLTSHEDLKNMDTAMTYSTNNLGFRGDRLMIPKPHNELRIFIIGGSTAQCLYIDDRKALGTVLQGELQNHHEDRTIKVYTAAKSGDASPDHIAMLSQRITHLEPDMVILFAGINDLRKTIQGYDYTHLGFPKMYTPHYAYLLATEFQTGRRLHHVLKKESHDLSRELVPLETNYRQLFALQQRTPLSDSTPRIDAVSYAINLKSLAGVCRDNGVPVIFIPNQSTWATPEMEGKHWLLTCGTVRYREELLKHGLNVFNETMKNVAAQMKIPVFDLPAMMDPTEEYFYDDCHFSVEGSVKCGKMLASFIINNNLSDGGDSVSTFKYK